MLSRRFVAGYEKIIMSTLLLSILGLSIGAQQCSVWRDIAPCTCRKDISRINVNCEKMASYAEVVNVLQNRFSPTDKIVLRIGSSVLEDLHQRAFKELNMTIESIQLNHDNLSDLSSHSFLGLSNVNFLSLSDNSIATVPEHILETVPNVKTLDLGRVGIQNLKEKNFKSIPYVQNIMLGGNVISQMEATSIPTNVRQLHLGRNKIKDLNGTLTNLTDLEWVFINANELATLENQLPITAPRLMMIHAANNKIERLPQHLKTFTSLQSLFIHNNMLTSLDGVLSKLRKLERAPFEYNRINMLTKEDFLETEALQCLCMGNNYITSINNSLSPLRSLSVLNLTHNLLSEFSLQEIKGLQKLRTVDLSHNKINTLLGPTANLVEWETQLAELILNNNDLYDLNGALSGLSSLIKVNLSFNKLSQISPDDLIGLDELQILDVSHNELITLEETGKSFLPALNELVASYNKLTVLEHDFHGLPVLCWADLSNNQIVALGRDLVSKTRCKLQDTWSTLKVLLQNNPILCDAALPEIVAAMEINHTRISGVSHCGPLSEQPTTSKPNGFLGFIPEGEQNIYTNNAYQVNSVYNQPTYSIEHQNALHQSKNEPVKFLSIENNENPVQTTKSNFDQSKLSNLQQNENSNINHDLTNMNNMDIVQSITTNQENHLSSSEPAQLKPYPLHLFEMQPSLQRNDQTVNINSFSQQEQLNILASQIKQLRLEVQQLTNENQILSQTRNQLPTTVIENDKTKLKNVEEVVIHSLSGEEISDKIEEMAKS